MVAHEDVLNPKSPQNRKMDGWIELEHITIISGLPKLSTLYESDWLGWGPNLLRYAMHFPGLC